MASLNTYDKTTGLTKLTLTGKTNDVMTGATSSANGKLGLAPQPNAGQQDYVLTGAAQYRKLNDMLEVASTETIDSLFDE